MRSFENWLSDLAELGDDEAIIADNWRRDPHIPREARDAVESCAISTSPKEILDHPEVKKHQLCDCNKVRACGTSLARVVRLGSFLKRHANAAGVFKPNLDGVDVDTLLANLNPASQCTGNLGQSECWGVPTNQFPSSEGDELRDNLGLSDFVVRPSARGSTPEDAFINDLLLVRYSITFQCYRPTVVEAGTTCAFLPSADGSDSGKIQDLRTGQQNVAEYVHPPVHANKIVGLQRRGSLTRAPSTTWKTHRMEAIRASQTQPSKP